MLLLSPLVRQMTVVADDGTHFEWTGSGPDIVLIHGFGLNSNMWQWQLPALKKKYRVLTYDLYGHGKSQNPPHDTNLTLFSEQIIGLLEQSGVEKCALIGFSLGGMIARRFALDHGERLSALAILNSPHARSPSERGAILQRVSQAARDGPSSTVEAALLRWFSENFRKNNPAMINLIRKWVLANDKTIYSRIYRVFAEGDQELVTGLDIIKCPALVMTGEEDYSNSIKMSEDMADMMSNAEVRILPALRHMALAEAPDMVNEALLSFLDNASLAG